MKPSKEQFELIIHSLQNGYNTDRKTVPNERLALIVILTAITKRQVPQILKIKRKQFFTDGQYCYLRIYSPKAHNIERIKLPFSFYEYIEDYCFRKTILYEENLLSLDSDYVGNRIRELCRLLNLSMGSRDLMKMIPHQINSRKYYAYATWIVDLVRGVDKDTYIGRSSADIEKYVLKLQTEFNI